MKNQKKLRLGVEEATLLKRKLNIVDSSSQIVTDAVSEIDKLYGVESVIYNPSQHVIKVEYDGRRLGIDCIINVLNNHLIPLRDTWYGRYRLSQYRFVDNNIQENLTHEPIKCH